MAKEDFFSRKLKDLDVFKRLPKELSKGSLFGVLCKLQLFQLASNSPDQMFENFTSENTLFPGQLST